MKTRNDKRTNVEQAMSDYLINLSNIYKNSYVLSDTENNEKKVWGKTNYSKLELVRKENSMARGGGSSTNQISSSSNNSNKMSGSNISRNNNSSNNNNSNSNCNSSSSRSRSNSAATNSSGGSTKDDDSSAEKSKSQYYEDIMNSIFTIKEREIYRNIKRLMKNEKNYLDIETNEYLYCYVFILAIKKIFYEIILQKKQNHILEKLNHEHVQQKQKNNMSSYYNNGVYIISKDQKKKSLLKENVSMELNHGEILYIARSNSTDETSKNGKASNNNSGSNGCYKGGHKDCSKDYDKDCKKEERIPLEQYKADIAEAKKKIGDNTNVVHFEIVDNADNADDYSRGKESKGFDEPHDDLQNGSKLGSNLYGAASQTNDGKRDTAKDEQNTATGSSANSAINKRSGEGIVKREKKKSNTLEKNYLTFIFEKLKNNKSYWLIPISVLSCIYLYYKMRERVSSFMYNHYMNISKYFSSMFLGNSISGDKLIYKDYNHFFYNISKNNIKEILFNPTNNTCSYLLNRNQPKSTGMMMLNHGRLAIGGSASASTPTAVTSTISPVSSSASTSSSSAANSGNNTYTIYYNDYIMKYLLKNRLYENVEMRVDEKVLKNSLFDIIKKNIIDIVTYSCSLLTFYYIYEKSTSPINNDCYSFDRTNQMESLNEIVLNEETKKDIKAVLFFLLYPKIFEENDGISCNTILFTGDTGTGKSLLAKIIAKELNYDLVHLSGSAFIELYIGNGASKIRNLFKKAKKNKKSVVIFIDEIDSIGLSRSMNDVSSNQNHEYTQTLNQLLVEIDALHEYNREQMQVASVVPVASKYGKSSSIYGRSGRSRRSGNVLIHLKNKILDDSNSENELDFKEKEDGYDILQYYLNNNLSLLDIEDIFNLKRYKRKKFILFIGATNRYKNLDSALIRSKRFDKIIHFQLPNLFTRRRLFDLYIQKYATGKNSNLTRTYETTTNASTDTNVNVNSTCWDGSNNSKMGNICMSVAPMDSGLLASEISTHLNNLEKISRQKKDNLVEYNTFEDKFGPYLGTPPISTLPLGSLPFGGKDKYNRLLSSLSRREDDRSGGSTIDTFTLSILSYLFNCADIDQLVYSIKVSSLMKSNVTTGTPLKSSYSKNIFYLQNNMNTIIFENLLSVLHKKFTYDNYAEKIFCQGDYEELTPSINFKLLNSTLSDINFEEYLNRFINFCNKELEKKIGENTAIPSKKKTNKISFNDLLFFYDLKEMKRKVWGVGGDDEDIGSLQNNFFGNTKFSKQSKSYHLFLLWKAIECFFTTLHVNYKKII
ncbi:AAA family ATPase [Plasmodium brasilianum]|uniref:AAA family ATPase, putative n=2 Tax=Plasmodium (Plasmodium) TaxID=418103 RepID=A0A1A8X8S1_PLAMA|nr:AAA family ATPase, putative [Plasmodium malariae]KAI4841299.1 AAA family ATPase [Plasmodium brasilianum]SBT01645.1 AAA family ATPase, putative [Plasmodium malariae]SBT86989.1 AAA family ATPase, putative [Plasmodium malariae]